jgi:hypothetical protein
MTEAEWLACTDPWAMLQYPGCASKRKLRLVACGCCQRVWHLVRDDSCKRIVELVERVADQPELEIRLPTVWDEVRRMFGHYAPPIPYPSYAAALTACVMPESLSQIFEHAVPKSDDYAAERTQQCALLRDIFGNPFRPVTFSPAWCTDTALSLAKQIYDSRDFSAMPILADALQDAGCDNDDILNHCRDTSVTHVRGCWAVDLILGKE